MHAPQNMEDRRSVGIFVLPEVFRIHVAYHRYDKMLMIPMAYHVYDETFMIPIAYHASQNITDRQSVGIFVLAEVFRIHVAYHGYAT